jgi:NADPH:quinone reductase-like Zn-dependent oxidoreductase
LKAIVQDVYGPADVLELRDVDRPAPGAGEVLIRVHAAGAGPDVWHLMTGLPYPARLVFGLRKPKNPVPGWDGAGVVEAVGPGVSDFEPGDAVYGEFRGSFAEYALAKTGKLAPKPDNLTFAQAAAVTCSGMTALQALHAKAGLRPGQKVLVIGASGGVGSLAVQLATAHGAEVTGVCGPAGADFVRSLGAVDVIDYTSEEITDRPRRYDVVLDVAGNRSVSLMRRVLAPKGVLVHIGGEGGSRWFADAGMRLEMGLRSLFRGRKLRGMLAVARREDLLTLNGIIEKGDLTPVVARTYPLSDAADAIRHLENGHPQGKIVVTVETGAA